VVFLCYLHEGEGFISFSKIGAKRENFDLRRCRLQIRRHFSASREYFYNFREADLNEAATAADASACG
jgi:hypothetical protein